MLFQPWSVHTRRSPFCTSHTSVILFFCSYYYFFYFFFPFGSFSVNTCRWICIGKKCTSAIGRKDGTCGFVRISDLIISPTSCCLNPVVDSGLYISDSYSVYHYYYYYWSSSAAFILEKGKREIMTVLAPGNIKIACCVRSSVTTFLLLLFFFVFCFYFGGRDRPFCKFFWKFFIPFVFTHSRPFADLVVSSSFSLLLFGWFSFLWVYRLVVVGRRCRVTFQSGLWRKTPYWDAWQPDLLLLLLL